MRGSVARFDAPRSAGHTGMPVLLVLGSALLGRSLRGGMLAIDAWNKLVAQPWTTMSVCLREWAHVY
jgi:hypothetical protein